MILVGISRGEEEVGGWRVELGIVIGILIEGFFLGIYKDYLKKV